MEDDIQKFDHGTRGVVWMRGRTVIATVRPVTGGAKGWMAKLKNGSRPFPPSSMMRSSTPSAVSHFANKKEAIEAVEKHLLDDVNDVKHSL